MTILEILSYYIAVFIIFMTVLFIAQIICGYAIRKISDRKRKKKLEYKTHTKGRG